MPASVRPRGHDRELVCEAVPVSPAGRTLLARQRAGARSPRPSCARRKCAPFAALGLLALASCSELGLGRLDRLDQPTGLALSPRGAWLLVSNGNWDQSRSTSALVTLDLRALEAGLDAPRAVGEELDADNPCRRSVDNGRIECDPQRLIDPARGLRLPSGAGNVLSFDRDPDRGSARALVPSRIDTALTWFDLRESAGGELSLDCARDLDAQCDDTHTLRSLPSEPGHIGLAAEYGRFAFVPHLLQRDAEDCEDDDDPRCSGLELLDLGAAGGPAIIDIAHNFFRTDPLSDSGLAGGFAVAERPCDLAAPPSLTRECTRPLLYASQRYWFGIRMFTVAPETGLISGGRSVMLTPNNLDAARPLPLNADLAFEDPDHLLLVHTTPPAISRIDTSIDDDGEPRNLISRTVPLCANPNHLELHQPDDAAHFAFVSCFSDDAVVALRLPELTPFRTLSLGQGANEMLIDPERRWLFVANTRENSISIVSLDLASPDYLREFATIGLGKERGLQ